MLILIPLLLLLPSSIQAQKCLKLTNSKTCPAFQSYYISLDTTSNLPQPSWLNGVTDIATFDNAIVSYLNSTSYADSFWKSQLGCQPISSDHAPYAQYSMSILCAQLILDPAVSLPCNFQYNILPNSLCASSCQNYTSSVQSILNDPRICNKQSTNSTGLSALQKICSSDGAISGTAANKCISASINEPQNCGFQNDTETLCSFCQANTMQSQCCAGIDCSKIFGESSTSSLSTRDIVGIAVGSAVAVVILGLIAWCCRRKYRHAPRQSMFTPYYKPANTREHSDIGKIMPIEQKMDMDRLVDVTPDMDPLEGDLFVGSGTFLDGYCQVVHAYYPENEDEVQLSKGDIVRLLYSFDDGWALADNITAAQRGLLPLLCLSSISNEEVAGALGMSLDDYREMNDPLSHVDGEDIDGHERQRNSHLLTDASLERLQRSLSVRTAILDNASDSLSLPQRSISMRQPQLIKRYSAIPAPYANDLSPASADASDDSMQALRPSGTAARSRYSQGYDIVKPTLRRQNSA